MIPLSTVFAFAAAAVFTVLAPIVMLIVLGIKRKISALPLLFGALAFFLSQVVLRMPLINILSGKIWYQTFAAQFFPYVLCLSLSAGLFEESARLFGALLLKRHSGPKDVLSFGLGHGLCEAVLLVGLSHLNSVILCLAVNGGGLPGLGADALGAAAGLAAVNPAEVFLGVLERVSAVMLHLFATVLVFKAVSGKKPRYYFLAVLAHTLFNLAAVLLTRFAGILAAELALLAAAGALGAYVAYVIRQTRAGGGKPPQISG